MAQISFLPKNIFFQKYHSLKHQKSHNRRNWAQNDTIKTKRWSFCVKYESCVCWSICLLIILQNKICKKICIHIRGLKWGKLVKITAKRDFKGENYYFMYHVSINVPGMSSLKSASGSLSVSRRPIPVTGYGSIIQPRSR